MKEVEPRNTRQRFLRQLGAALAAGIGVVLLPGKKARAGVTAFQCCISSLHCSQGCPQGQANYYCDCGTFQSSYCTGCRSNIGSCYPAPC
jgi:hypothetical protein